MPLLFACYCFPQSGRFWWRWEGKLSLASSAGPVFLLHPISTVLMVLKGKHSLASSAGPRKQPDLQIMILEKFFFVGNEKWVLSALLTHAVSCVTFEVTSALDTMALPASDYEYLGLFGGI